MKGLIILLLSLLSLGNLMAETPQGNSPNDSLYQDAFAKIKAMLEGKTTLSFKEAVYLTENAYLGGELDYTTFNIQLQLLARLGDITGKQEQLDYHFEDSTNVRNNWGITRLFMDTFQLYSGVDSIEWLPTQYNFDDPLGQKEWSNTFVSTLLETGVGNCHSLPFLYKILAEETNTNVSLALAPSHIYLKARTKNYQKPRYNIELTGKGHPIDGWVMTTSYVSLEAVQSGLYMKELDLKQSIILTLLDLAQGYEKSFPNADKKFVLNCVEEALKYFPTCVNAKLLKIEFLANQYKLNPTPNTLNEIREICNWLLEQGYDEMPLDMYADGLTTNNRYERKEGKYLAQDKKNTDPYGFGATPTLTNGKYPETHTKDNLERIGSILFNRVTGKVESIEQHQKIGDLTMNPSMVGRFLSVDPLTRSYPMLTPYQFASNRPIDGIDLEGLQWSKHTSNGKVHYTVKITVVNESFLSRKDFKAAIKETKNQFQKTISGTGTNGVEFSGKLKVMAFNSLEAANKGRKNKPTIKMYFKNDWNMTIKGQEGLSSIDSDAAQGQIEINSNKGTAEDKGVTATHEILHTGGLKHPWDSESGTFEHQLFQAMIDKLKINPIGFSNETISGSINLLQNNIMSTSGSLADKLIKLRLNDSDDNPVFKKFDPDNFARKQKVDNGTSLLESQRDQINQISKIKETNKGG